MRTSKPFFSLQTIMTLLVCGVVALSLAVTDILISQKVADNTQKNLADKATNIARIVAHSPLVIETLNGQRANTEIQPFANEIRQITAVEFVVVMDMKGIRKSHPAINKVGQPFVGGDEGDALKGHEYVSNAKGTLGMSLRAFTPIVTSTGKTALTAYREWVCMTKDQEKLSQAELDIRMLHPNPLPVPSELPKGLTRNTLKTVWENIQGTKTSSFSTEEMAKRVGISRVSMRKYLSFLTDIGVIEMEVIYGSVGRPVYQHRCLKPESDLIKTYF